MLASQITEEDEVSSENQRQFMMDACCVREALHVHRWSQDSRFEDRRKPGARYRKRDGGIKTGEERSGPFDYPSQWRGLSLGRTGQEMAAHQSKKRKQDEKDDGRSMGPLGGLRIGGEVL
ncbi:hypothetical protein DPEC_G00125240 [Dallia pectoralis]|uniref:Uncharacterized protein n=1 Tax=Dallia pectoralis TaxID=75939 RepID=A0ACC2GQY3_DALPE|nr:hypothetical protein DPEC_G00125240 [Dallia pectoralis]